MELHSLLRRAENEALSSVVLSGKVLDLGGDRRSTYQRLMKGEYELTIVNMNEESKPDVMHDLEQPLPLADGGFDTVLLINVLEHIYECKQLVREARRMVRAGGEAIIVVPFLFPLHPSPHDYWRFTDESLKRILEEAGFNTINIQPLGAGVFSARFQLLNRLLPGPLRWFDYALIRPLIILLDHGFTVFARSLGKQYTPHDYPLGYFVRAAVR